MYVHRKGGKRFQRVGVVPQVCAKFGGPDDAVRVLNAVPDLWDGAVLSECLSCVDALRLGPDPVEILKKNPLLAFKLMPLQTQSRGDRDP